MDPLKKASFPYDGKPETYDLWSRQIDAALRLQGLAAPLAAADANAAAQQHNVENTNLYYQLVINLNGSAAALSRRVAAGNGRALWDLLRTTCGAINNSNGLMTQLLAMKMDDYDCTASLVRAMEAKVDQMRGPDGAAAVQEGIAKQHLFRLLPPAKYAAVILKVVDGNQTWTELCAQVITFAAIIGDVPQASSNATDDDSSSSSSSRDAKALFVRSQRPGNTRRPDAPFNGECDLCHNKGHRANECRNAIRALEQVRANKPRQQNNGRSRKIVDNDIAANIFFCDTDIGDSKDSAAALAATAADAPDELDLVVDSGASSHILGNATLFTGLQPSTVTVHLADRTSKQVSGTGSAHISAQTDDGRRHSFVLSQALLLPGANNLFSISRFCARLGNKVFLSDKQPHLRLANGISIPLIKDKGLFLLRVRIATALPAPVPVSATALSAAQDSPLERHQAYAHLNEAALHSLGVLLPNEHVPFCEDCALAKSTHKSVPDKAADRDRPIGSLISSDICGPFENGTVIGGCRYMINFIEHTSRYSKIYLSSTNRIVESMHVTFGPMPPRPARAAGGSATEVEGEKLRAEEPLLASAPSLAMPPPAPVIVPEPTATPAAASTNAPAATSEPTQLPAPSAPAAVPVATPLPAPAAAAAAAAPEAAAAAAAAPRQRLSKRQAAMMENRHLKELHQRVPVSVGETSNINIDTIANISSADATAMHVAPDDPRTYAEAMGSSNAKEWRDAIELECRAIMDQHVFDLVAPSDLPAGSHILKSALLFKTKPASSSQPLRYKCRLVVKGCAQRPGEYGEAIFAPVVSHTSLRLLLAIAAAKDYVVEMCDINHAFLAAPLDREQQPLFMDLPAGWPTYLPGGTEHPDTAGKLVCRLRKSLYGLRQAPRLFYELLSAWLVSYGFVATHSDACVFVMRLPDNTQLICSVFVDDLLWYAKDVKYITAVKQAMCERFSVKLLGPAKQCLGMRFTITKGRVMIDQQRYVEGLLERLGMADCKPLGTPLVPGTHLVAASSDPTNPEHKLLSTSEANYYREGVGSCLYLTSLTRPDIANAVNQLSRHMATPTVTHLQALKHLLRHLRGTAALGLVYTKGKDANTLCGYADSSLASDPTTSRSISAYAFLLNNAAISWRSKVQSTVALSTAESEFDAVCEATREVRYLRNLLQELGFDQDKPTVIYEDNQPCIALALNPVTSSGRTRHAALRFHFVREGIADKTLQLVYCPTSDMVADGLTKPLPLPQHCKLRSRLLGAPA